MKVHERVFTTAVFGRIAAALAAAVMSITLAVPQPAGAITRGEIIERADGWVRVHTPYNQSGYYGGYRRDCSGFVSMAWRIDQSLTTRTMGEKATRIKAARLKPGDAVLMPGHIVIFQRWSDRKRGIYVSMESSGRYIGTIRRLRRLTPASVPLSFVGLTGYAKPAPSRRAVLSMPKRRAVISMPKQTAEARSGERIEPEQLGIWTPASASQADRQHPNRHD